MPKMHRLNALRTTTIAQLVRIGIFKMHRIKPKKCHNLAAQQLFVDFLDPSPDSPAPFLAKKIQLFSFTSKIEVP